MLDLIKLLNNHPHIPKDTPVILGVSGGVDSMVLCALLVRLKYNVVIAHVNHKIRKESNDEYQQIKQYAKKHNIPFEGHVIEDKITGNFQLEARHIRLNFFKKIANKYDTKIIITAHHLDDQVETFFMRLIKGYSLTSLTAIEPVTSYEGYQIIRPLLTVSKQRLIDYATAEAVTYFEDASNRSDDYFRNRVRNTLLPFLVEENPNLHESVQSYIDQFKALKGFLDSALPNTDLKNTIDLIALKGMNTLLQMTYLNKVLDDYISSQHNLKAILSQLLSATPNIDIPINETTLLRKTYDTAYVTKNTSKPYSEVVIKTVGTYPINNSLSYIVSHDKLCDIHSNYFILWYNNKVFPIILRNRQKGDKIDLNVGTKKIKDLLIDEKIPMTKRDSLFLLAKDDKILWIPELNKRCEQDKKQPNKLYIYEVNNAK